jgi:hypothetical protein
MIKKNKILGIFLIMMIMVSFAMPIYGVVPDDTQTTTNKALEVGQRQVEKEAQGLIEKGLGSLTGFAEKIFGLNPIVHGLLVGAFSGIKTLTTLSKLEIDFSLDRDKVNISEDLEDYYVNQDDFIFQNRIDTKEGQRPFDFENLLLTDKNIIDALFLETKDLREIDDGKNSPQFRLAENTKLLTLLDSNNQPMDIQKREILFEDKESTIQNEYEYRNFVIKYPKTTYAKNIKYSLTPQDIFNGKFLSQDWLFFLAQPFSTGARLINIERVLNSNDKFLETVNQDRKDQIITEPFKLIFNSYIRDQLPETELDEVNCISESGMRLGSTGTEQLPKVALNWNFVKNQNVETIAGTTVNTSNWCDGDLTGKDDKEYIFCDSTQFTIEILNKLKDIDDFVQTNKSNFNCPTPGVTQALLSNNNNLAITQLNSSYDNTIVTVDYKLEGSFNLEDINAQQMKDQYGNIQLKVYKNNVLEEEITKEVKISTFQDDEYFGQENFNVGLILDDQTAIKVEAILTLVEPFLSLETTNQDNLLINQFTPNSEICNVDKTSKNINLFLPINYQKLDTSLYDFRAYLMKDGFSNDFKQDFDKYYRFTIASAPTYYTEDFYKYLISEDFKFKSTLDFEPGKLTLQGPGRYYVEVLVTFDSQWNLFDTQGNITGDVEVILSREIRPERDSPLYYMPFNGLVGIDTENARQGYGVDFTGDVITIAELSSTGEFLRTEPFTQSNTINTVSVKERGKNPTEFSFLNNGATRGMLLDISLSETKSNPEIFFSPSRATPVALKVSNSANNAYAFYKLDIGGPQNQGGEPAQISGSLVPWTGIGNCYDFSAIPVQEAFLGRPDIHAMSSRLAPVTPSQSVTYGVEWESKNITRTGNVFLRTIFYTPSNFKTGNGISVLTMDAVDDEAEFYTYQSQTASNSINLTNSLGSDIKYLSEIFSLVKDKQACIDYSSNNLKVYYNPIAITEKLFQGDASSDAQNEWVNARGECIVN